MAKRKRNNKESQTETKQISQNSGNNVKDAPWSKSKKKRMRKLLSKKQQQPSTKPERLEKKSVPNDKTTIVKQTKGKVKHESIEKGGSTTKKINSKSALQQAFLKRLSGSRFRDLNEKLYTSDSSWAFREFKKHPELFDQYHEGFRNQVESWPTNPVHVMVRWIQKHASKNLKKKNQPLIIADFGCGEAKLAEQLLTSAQKEQYKVHSFDLVANGNKYITPCDIANTPLEKESIDVGIFCLALMGTNLHDFMKEAHRVLKVNGILKLAEVVSRFDPHDFCQTMLSNYGFVSMKPPDTSNKMFVMMEFQKSSANLPKTSQKIPDFQVKPCIYKRR